MPRSARKTVAPDYSAANVAKVAKAAPGTLPGLAKDGVAILALREPKSGPSMPWSTILDATGASSGIPLRNLINRARGAVVPATPANVVRLRDREGRGFPAIAGMIGKTIGETRDLYAKGDGANVAGRVYVRDGAARIYFGADRPEEAIVAKPAKRRRRAPAAKPAK